MVLPVQYLEGSKPFCSTQYALEGYFKYTAYSKLLDGLGIFIDSHGLAVKLMGVFGEKKVLPGQEAASTGSRVTVLTFSLRLEPLLLFLRKDKVSR